VRACRRRGNPDSLGRPVRRPVIYDPRRRVLELRLRILESMTAEEIERYAAKVALDQASTQAADLNSTVREP
jgi:hypothetical protein